MATFETERGSFTVPARLVDADDWESEAELRRLFARSLPEHDPAVTLTTTRKRSRDGVLVTWHRTYARIRRA